MPNLTKIIKAHIRHENVSSRIWGGYQAWTYFCVFFILVQERNFAQKSRHLLCSGLTKLKEITENGGKGSKKLEQPFCLVTTNLELNGGKNVPSRFRKQPHRKIHL